MNIIKKSIYILGVMFLVHFPAINAQIGDTVKPPPLDSNIRYGRLSNGFTYYLKHVENSREKLNMRFYVKTGIYHQDKGQQDFAHGIEHLAFRAAKNFPGRIKSDKRLLVRLGMTESDILGQTGDVYTSFSFDIPSKHMEALDTGLLWFHDIIDLELDSDNINTEKGPLRQELIYRQGDDIERFFLRSKLRSVLFPCIQDWSNFFEHNKTFIPESLIQFYKDWYHPDRMAVVVVGDMANMDRIESHIKARFLEVKRHNPSKPWSDCRCDFLEGPNRFVVVESGIGKHYIKDEPVELYLYMRDKEILSEGNTWEGLKRKEVWSILGKMANERFRNIIGAYTDVPTPTFPGYSIRIKTKKEQGQQVLKKCIHILQQIKRYGFTQEEWEQAKKEQLQALQPIDTVKSDYWIKQIKDHYVYGEALPTNKAIGLNQWLLDLSLKDFNTLSRQYLSDTPDDIGIIAPNKEIYTESEVRGWIDQVLAEEIISYTAPETPKQLLKEEEISALREGGYTDKGINETGAKELVLDNGVKVVLYPTELDKAKNKDRIFLHGFSPKGASCFPKEDYFSAINAPSIIKNGGFGNMDTSMLHRFLAETSFEHRVRTYIDYTETGIKGDAILVDLEKMLQLVYLYFTNPRKDKPTFENWITEQQNMYLNPSYGVVTEDFKFAKLESLGDSSVAPRGTKRFKGISKTDMDRAHTIYRQLFGDAKDFTFLVSGNFSVDTVLPLVQKYLGNLPTLVNVTSCPMEVKKEKELAQGPLYIKFSADELGASYKMKSVRYALSFIAKTDEPLDWKEHIKVNTLGLLLDSKIQELRYSKGASLYNYNASGKFNRYLAYYAFEISLDCVPGELESLRKECKEIVGKVKKNSFNKERFKEVYDRVLYPKYIENRLSLLEPPIMKKLYEFYRYGVHWVKESEMKTFVKYMTLEDIQETAQKYLTDENMMEFVMKDSNKCP